MNTPPYALSRRPLINNLSLFSVLLLSIGLSALDGLSTLVLLDRGIASEGNPVMAVLIRQDPAIFFAVKMTLTVFGLLLCYQFQRLWLGRLGLKLAGLIYIALSLYHGFINATY